MSQMILVPEKAETCARPSRQSTNLTCPIMPNWSPVGKIVSELGGSALNVKSARKAELVQGFTAKTFRTGLPSSNLSVVSAYLFAKSEVYTCTVCSVRLGK